MQIPQNNSRNTYRMLWWSGGGGGGGGGGEDNFVKKGLTLEGASF